MGMGLVTPAELLVPGVLRGTQKVSGDNLPVRLENSITSSSLRPGT